MRRVGRYPLICMLIVSLFIMLFAAIAEADPSWDQHARNTSERRDPSWSPYNNQTPEEETSMLSLCVPFAVAASVIALWVFATFLEKRENQLLEAPKV
jgi:hypothetical protein